MDGTTGSQIAQRVGVSRQNVNIGRNQNMVFMQELQERWRVVGNAHGALDADGRAGDGGGGCANATQDGYLCARLADFQGYGEVNTQ